MAHSRKKANDFWNPSIHSLGWNARPGVRAPTCPPGGRSFPPRAVVRARRNMCLDLGKSRLWATNAQARLVVSGQIDLEGSSGRMGHRSQSPRVHSGRPSLRSQKWGRNCSAMWRTFDRMPASGTTKDAGRPRPLPLAREMLRYAVGMDTGTGQTLSVAQHFFAALSHLCREWFSKPRILWLPVAKSPRDAEAGCLRAGSPDGCRPERCLRGHGIVAAHASASL